jgi:hypothetical protein
MLEEFFWAWVLAVAHTSENGTLIKSEMFETRSACVADAFENGYCAGGSGQSIVREKDLPATLRSAA